MTRCTHCRGKLDGGGICVLCGRRIIEGLEESESPAAPESAEKDMRKFDKNNLNENPGQGNARQ